MCQGTVQAAGAQQGTKQAKIPHRDDILMVERHETVNHARKSNTWSVKW